MSQQSKTTADDTTIIFTDGAARGNPGPGGWGAIVVFSTSHDDRHVVELGGREAKTTNNRMELTALIEALTYLDTYSEIRGTNPKLRVYSDSTYLINGATRWLPAWIANEWRTKGKQAVANQDLWRKIDELLKRFTISFEYVSGHVGIGGNERADQIATVFADNQEMTLENTTLSEYPVDLSVTADNETAFHEKHAKRERSRGKAYSYISLVDGTIKTHKTWDQCKQRVQGKQARFRKALSKEEESQIIDEFKSRLSS